MTAGIGAMLVRMGLALVLGAVVGWEREAGGKQAGLRTHMLVCLGSCLFTLVGLRLAVEMVGTGVMIDPSRIVQGIIGGIGFLGAGTLIREGVTVRGLTTAATIWTMGAVGVAAGMGYWLLAVVGVLLALVVLRVVGTFEKAMARGKLPKGGAG